MGDYPFEAFVYDQYSKNTLYLILECLAESMITNTMPINVETAWMRIPFFMDKINRLVLQEKWADAAKLTEILTQIKKKFDKQDYYINAEQAGWLYYKSANFLKASAMLQGGINETDALKFKEFYVQDLISQGDRSFKVKRYRNAAEKYEKAALWASIELNNIELNQKSINQAIFTWISACEIPNAFKLIEKLDHTEQLKTMQNLTPKIASATDFLISQNNFDVAKTQLYYAIDKYQRAGLFEDVKKLAEKMITLMKVILQNNIREEFPDEAMLAVDEIINIWETFELKKENIDSILEAIANVYIKKHEFSAIDKLLMKVSILKYQGQLVNQE
jgi:tetratricopeptide (TPR) repeat protein